MGRLAAGREQQAYVGEDLLVRQLPALDLRLEELRDHVVLGRSAPRLDDRSEELGEGLAGLRSALRVVAVGEDHRGGTVSNVAERDGGRHRI